MTAGKTIRWYIYIASEDRNAYRELFVWGYSGQSMKLPPDLHLVHRSGIRAIFARTPLYV